MSDHGYKEGDDVYVFYRMGKRCVPQRKYMATLDPRQGAYRPRTGLTDGWVPAAVVQADKGGVKVAYRWNHFFTMRGHMADPDSGWTEWYPHDDVCPAPADSARLELVPQGSVPELALITFRWGGMNEVVAPGQWGETGSSVSDIFIDSFVDKAVIPQLKRSYEVWTVYVEDHSDILKVADAAHLIFGPSHPARRARQTRAMYHLYPTSFQENCVPNKETGSDGGAALVDHKALFKMIQAVERAGIATCFPHPSGFYELLSSKRWTYMMCLTPHLRVPPTVSLPRMLIEQSCASAAEKALASLEKVRAQQALLRNEPPPREPITKGVAKLGFSWEALDVKFWEKQKGLQDSLYQLTQAIEISQEITGQPHDLEAIIVQEYCKHDLEVRLYVVEGKVETAIYTKFCKIKDNLEFGDFKELFTQKEAGMQWMGGDLAAMESGEKQCREITEQWLIWVRSQICDLPPAIRFDYFVGRGAKPGEAEVWTLEICELGFSMLGAKELPDKVFQAMLRSCLGTSGSSSAPPADAQGATAAAAPAAPALAPKAEPASPAAADPPAAAAAEASPAAEAGAEEDAADPAAAAEAGPPRELVIAMGPGTAPGTTQDQQKCEGKYEMVQHAEANDCPVWMHSRGDRFLFHGNDGCWYVGDEEEQDLNFNCDQGYIRHEGDGTSSPHLLAGPWLRGPEWSPDCNICVSLDGRPSPAAAQANKGKGKANGKGQLGGKSVG